ncbi:class I SAM-dependent methyltransferase [Micromonospora polyrhachis]|uniref:Ubiquinone/menaquinone biosynthesis C-methylase UbiE n=1 Tax=Micromonospora polyrhachis TaxID=1282883 RepID=A0A7W7SRN7_9ACTN|nr:class I SAM-dependent methyltransferase [Micromonospora polyrhachis]MBB4959699.1 ubiquinone/menaquinone biosynthesis C-methylase UbiE [Micromonospora polyrhachis]
MAWLERRFFADSRTWVCRRAHGTTLEIAIGTGANLPHYPGDVDLTGIDWSPAMLHIARHQAERVRRAVALSRTDATALPFPTATFDTVVSTFALCCIPDERAALVEALRVLRPGGRLLLVDHVAASFWPLRALQHVVDLASIPLQGEHYTRRPVTILRGLDVTIEETERLARGVIERVHARKLH